MSKQIACNYSAFSSNEERIEHEKQSTEISSTAKRVEELRDGYAFFLDYSPGKFISYATWISDENKCCPFFTFELTLQPTDETPEIILKLRGSEEIKQFIRGTLPVQ